jgi:8-oxo-dGTP pyrophosphatase MutT (NUDIX family)
MSQNNSRPRRNRRNRGNTGTPPDILYHATTVARAGKTRTAGVLEVAGGRPVYLSRSEAQAWQVAHRQSEQPEVLFIGVARARRDGCRFERNRHGLWQCRAVPVRHVLNLRSGFAEQISAGGLPVWYGPDGPRLALIRVRRPHSSTWEVAKGKLEPGEPPHIAGMREVCEEMGADMPLSITHDLGSVRFGFYTPGGEPRLKTLHIYLMESPTRVSEFNPAEKEGIQEVAWFTPQEAARAVTHRSLRPLMRRVKRLLEGGEDEANEDELLADL